MTICVRRVLRMIANRMVIAAVASAVVVGMLPPNSLALKVLETASIVQEPSTIGIADSNLYNQSQADVDRTLDTLQAMGVQNVRIVIPWAGVQPLDRPTYYWTNVDRMVNAAAQRNMGVLAVLNSTPAWASDRYLSGHPDPNQFAQFAGLVADRYKGEIAAYEVWNEPNAITFWNPVDPVAYTHLLQAGYTAIKTEDPNAVVVGGVVASLFTAGNVTINPQDFIAQMYDAGAKGYFDAISFHPYHFSLEFSQGNNHPLSAEQQVQEMYQVMVNHGDGDLKIWATEYGMPTAEVNGEVVTEEQQAAFIDDFLHAWQKVDGAGPMFIYTFRDSYSGDPDIQKNFGIFYTDWTPKLAAQVIAQFAGGLVPERPNRPIIDAALAITRAIVNATSRLIHAGVQLFAAAVDVTVRFIAGLVDLGVRFVKGVVDTIGRVIDAVTGRFRPDAAAAAKTATELPGPTALASNTSPPDNTTVTHKRGNSTKAEMTAEPVATDTKPAVAKEDSNSDNKTTTRATKKAEPEPASVTPDKPIATADTTSMPKTDPDPSADANTTNAAKDDDATAPGDQETKKPKKNQKSCSGCDGAG